MSGTKFRDSVRLIFRLQSQDEYEIIPMGGRKPPFKWQIRRTACFDVEADFLSELVGIVSDYNDLAIVNSGPRAERRRATGETYPVWVEVIDLPRFLEVADVGGDRQ